MKKHIHIIKPVLIMLLVLCTVLSSCVTGDAPLTGTDNGTHEHSTTGETGTQAPPSGDQSGGDTPGGDQPGGDTPACTHATTTLVGATEATCAKEGYTGDTVCTACTEVVTQGTSIAKKAHTWNDGETTKNPTCISTGVKTITCTACGDTKTDTLSTVDHNDLYHDRLDGTHSHTCTTCTLSENKEHNADPDSAIPHAASCLEPAYVDFTCLDCEGVYKVYSDKEEDKATGHSFGEWTVLSDSTCKATGMKTRSCECGVHEELTIEIDDNKHQWVEEGRSAATCIAAGSVTYVCTVCSDHKSSPLTATGVHKYETLATGTDGWTTQECRHCHNQIKSFNAADVVAEVKAEALPENEDFGVTTQTATIEFPKEVVSQLRDGGSADIAIGAEVVKDKENLLANASKLSEAQKERLSDVDIFDFSVMINDQKLEDNFEKPVTVTMPYTLKEGENPDGIVIWYVADDGEIEEIAAVYDAETGTVSFSAAHFSFYAVAYKETQEMQCRRGHHAYLPTDEVVESTCESFGYTVCKCVCGAKMLDNIVEKLGHDYGDDVIKAEVDCENGGWDYQECSKCHHVLNIKYVAALGHTPDKVATCTEPSTCTTCHQVVKAALGHAWTEWTVVLEPTEVNSGLRRRYCLTCGEKEDVRLAATGNIQAITFESYDEMLGAILSETLNLGNGTVCVSYIMNGVTYTFDMKVNEENGAYVLLIDLTMSTVRNGESLSQTYTVLYRNGVISYVHQTGDGQFVDGFDLETVIGAPFEIAWDYLEQIFNLIDPTVAMGLEEVKALLDEYGAIYGADINKALADAGAAFTYEELYSFLDSFETVYAYVALKLGYQSSLSMHEGVEIPTKNDFVAVISAFMDKTEGNGRVDYEWNIEPLMNSLNTVIDWLSEECEKPLSEVFYDLFGKAIAEAIPELTDWEACVTYIRENLPGTTTIQDAVDWLITLIEDYESFTLEDIYALIDAYAYEMSGEEFDTAAFVAEYGEMTLDDLVEAMVGEEGATLDMLYEQIDAMLSEMLFGDLTLRIQGEELAIADLVAMASQYLSMFDVTLDFSFAVDEKGNLLELNLDHKLSVNGEDENGDPVTMEIESMTVTVAVDDSVTIDVPAIMQPALSDRVIATYDQNGNLIIKGLDGSFTYEFFIGGGDRFDLTEQMKRDDAMSAQLGVDVYVTDKAFWTQTQSVDNGYIFKINGKYYNATYQSISGYYEITNTVTWDELLADPSVLMPSGEEKIDGYYMDYPVYETEFGFVYFGVDGWTVIEDYTYNWNWIYDETLDKEFNTRVFEVYSEYTLESLFAGAYIGSIEQNNQKYELDGETVYLDRLSVSFAERYFNISLECYLDGDTIVVAQTRWVESTGYYVLGNEITRPEHDRIYEWSTTTTYVDKDGNEVTGEVIRVNLSKKLPTYYVKVNDSTYVSINNLCEDVTVDGLTQITLPDGNVMYVLGTQIDKNSSMGGNVVIKPVDGVVSTPTDGSFNVVVGGGSTSMGDMLQNMRMLTYGYVKLADGLYVQARCYVTGDVIEALEYRDTVGDVYKNFDEVYELEDYLTKNSDGSYTVSAELINKLKEQCSDEGDMFAINLRGIKKDGDVTYTVSAVVGTYMVPVTLQLGGMMGGADSEAKHYDWDELFNGTSMDGNFYQTQINPDGSVTLIFRNGAKLDVSIETGNQVLVDDYLVFNPEESEKTGLKIYDCIENKESSYSFVFKDGKYYSYTWGTGYELTLVDTLEDLLEQGWIINEMTYRYDVRLDENSDEYTPVYDARVYLHRDTGWSFYNTGITVYFMVIDGELYALTQAVELGDAQLRFEGYVKASEYFASLVIVGATGDQHDQYTTVYIDGVATDVYRESVKLYETDANGDPIVDASGKGFSKSTSVYYILVDGQKKYVTLAERENQSLVVVGNEVTVHTSEYQKTSESTSDYANGSFTIVYMVKKYAEITHFVKLAGVCYRLDSYISNRISEDSFREFFYEEMYCYRVWDDSANAYKYYENFEIVTDDNGKEVIVLMDETTVDYDGDLYGKQIGVTADGVQVYSVTVHYLNPDEVVVTDQEDGTVLYARPAYADYYLKAQDGCYVRAGFVLNPKTGVEEIVCNLERAYVSEETFEDMDVIDQFITVEGNKLTISKDIFELINDDNRYEFQIKINLDNKQWIYLDYYQLIQMFNINEGGNDDGKEDPKEDWGDMSEEDTYIDTNGNGMFDKEDYWEDLNGNGKFDGKVPGAENQYPEDKPTDKPTDEPTDTPNEDWVDDGEEEVKTWVDVNGNGMFDEEDAWKDLNGNGKFDGKVPGAENQYPEEDPKEDGTVTDKEEPKEDQKEDQKEDSKENEVEPPKEDVKTEITESEKEKK